MSPGNLEALRAIKNRMVRLFTRVETIRELLERLLDDDDDMRDMNLTAKCAPNVRSLPTDPIALWPQSPGPPGLGGCHGVNKWWMVTCLRDAGVLSVAVR